MTKERFVFILEEFKRSCGQADDSALLLDRINEPRVNSSLIQKGITVEEITEFNEEVWRDSQAIAAVVV